MGTLYTDTWTHTSHFPSFPQAGAGAVGGAVGWHPHLVAGAVGAGAGHRGDGQVPGGGKQDRTHQGGCRKVHVCLRLHYVASALHVT